MSALGRLVRGAALALAAAALACAAGCDKRAETANDAGAAPAASTSGRPFTILAGSELKDLEPALVAAGRGAGVEVKLSYAGTLDIVERINAGEKFDAILPPNGAYPALALTTKPLARDKLFYSRVALGVKQAKLNELGWAGKAPSWADIAKAASAGKLRYAMTNPASSNTGMSALFAVASASAGKSETLAVGDVDDATLKAFLGGQKLTAGSSGWLADAFVKDPSQLDAMVNYEAVILRANARLAPADKLALVYPRDGMISADYPLMLLNADKRADDTALVAALKAAPFQRDALSAMFIRPSNPDVAASPAQPTAAAAELSFPNKLDVIDAVLSAYQAQWRRPSTSIFVLDISGSMRGERIEGMREALKVLAGVDASTASARYAAFQQREHVVLIAFDNNVEAPEWIRFDQGDVAAARGAAARAGGRARGARRHGHLLGGRDGRGSGARRAEGSSRPLRQHRAAHRRRQQRRHEPGQVPPPLRQRRPGARVPDPVRRGRGRRHGRAGAGHRRAPVRRPQRAAGAGLQGDPRLPVTC